MRKVTKPSPWTVRLGLSLACVAGLTLGQTLAQELPAPEAEPTAKPAPAGELLPNLPVQKVSLPMCLAVAMDHQPALTAARASLAAAQSAQRGVNNIRFGRLLAPDLSIRRQQACLGVQIAAAGLFQTEWETRYAVTRNYYSVIYARQQTDVVQGLVDKLDRAADKAKLFIDAADPKIKVSILDHQNLIINRDYFKARQQEAVIGVKKAVAALREAIGVHHELPLDAITGAMPELTDSLDKDALIAMAVAQRGEMTQAALTSRVTDLEISAQAKIFLPSARTFAMGADIHAKPIPQGVANTEYRPGAIGPEMPVSMAGPRHDRMDRARDLSARAGAVVSKTENLIALEVEAAYLKWHEAISKAKILKNNVDLSEKFYEGTKNSFYELKGSSIEDLIRASTMADQNRVAYLEALYFHTLALAALERTTAGGFRFPDPQP